MRCRAFQRTDRARYRTAMHRTAEHVVRVLRSAGATGEVREFARPVPTAATAAAQLGCDVGAIANSLVFDAGGAPLLILTSGAHRVDTPKVAAMLGVGSVSRADPQFVLTHTGQRIGGVAPVGHPSPVTTFVDVWLDKHEVVWAAAGHPNVVFATSFQELLRITGGAAADVGS
jgi:prolyl-tRNA editing enzyme YbaK/EbsC (Cys-tRNA(Pro) deacylase)